MVRVRVRCLASCGARRVQIGNIHYSRNAELLYTNDLYKKFATETNWKVLVFSGDADSAVPFIGTQRWISCLKRPVKRDWRFVVHTRAHAHAHDTQRNGSSSLFSF